jgi:glycosyltransferase involved in cell wall biosynthesis
MQTTQPLRVLLLIPHLGGGGAEQVTALLARGLSCDKYELHLGLVTQAHAEPEAMPRWVHVHALGALRVRTGAFKLLRLVWRLKPDVILSGMFHLNFLVLLLRPLFPPQTCVLVRQNGTVSAALAFANLPGYTRFLYRALYRRADRVICQTQAMAKDLAAELAIDEKQLAVLLNPVDVEAIRSAAKDDPAQQNDAPSSSAGPHLLAVGRLSPEKGFDLLLQALILVRERFPLTKLVIAGSGPEAASLKAMCRDLGLDASVRFAGQVDCPSAYFREAAAFVLSSRHEGMPNALLEAAAGGLPIVATPASGGVVDLLRDQPGVWLAAEISSQALAASLLAALEALQHGERFAHRFIEPFRIDHAIHAYEDLIDTVLRDKQISLQSLDATIEEPQR